MSGLNDILFLAPCDDIKAQDILRSIALSTDIYMLPNYTEAIKEYAIIRSKKAKKLILLSIDSNSLCKTDKTYLVNFANSGDNKELIIIARDTFDTESIIRLTDGRVKITSIKYNSPYDIARYNHTDQIVMAILYIVAGELLLQ